MADNNSLEGLIPRLAAIQLYNGNVTPPSHQVVEVPTVSLSINRPIRVNKTRKRSRKKSLAQTIELVGHWVRNDAAEFFINTMGLLLPAWQSLLIKTTIPTNIPATALDLTTSIQTLENVIFSRDGSIDARFGYARLASFFEHLESRIRQDRQRGLIPPAPGRGNATIALDMYISSQSKDVADSRLRAQIRERKRVGGRWKEFAGPSMLLLQIYSNQAQSIVMDHSKTDIVTLRILASRALKTVPTNLIKTCVQLSREIEQAVELNFIKK